MDHASVHWRVKKLLLASFSLQRSIRVVTSLVPEATGVLQALYRLEPLLLQHHRPHCVDNSRPPVSAIPATVIYLP
jgi:hypothetical protein